MQGLKFTIPAILLSVGLSVFLFIKKDSKPVKSSPIQNSLSVTDTTVKRIIKAEVSESHIVINGVDNTVNYIAQKPKRLDELSDSIEKLSMEIEVLEKTKPSKPRKETKGRHTFNIMVDPREYPHLFCFDDILYEWDESRSPFTDSLYQKVWDDAKLNRGDNIDDYILTLIKNKQETKIFAFPVYKEKAFGSVMKIFEQKVAIYQAKL